MQHLLVQALDVISHTLEDDRAAALLTLIDCSKAFNRLSFQHCLRAFTRKGASTPLLDILATFLSNRTMTVKVGQEKPDPRPVFGGVPQGSILGFFLFNVSTDDVEDEDQTSDPEREEDGASTGLDDSVEENEAEGIGLSLDGGASGNAQILGGDETEEGKEREQVAEVPSVSSSTPDQSHHDEDDFLVHLSPVRGRPGLRTRDGIFMPQTANARRRLEAAFRQQNEDNCPAPPRIVELDVPFFVGGGVRRQREQELS